MWLSFAAYENEDRLLWDPYKLESSKGDSQLPGCSIINNYLSLTLDSMG